MRALAEYIGQRVARLLTEKLDLRRAATVNAPHVEAPHELKTKEDDK